MNPQNPHPAITTFTRPEPIKLPKVDPYMPPNIVHPIADSTVEEETPCTASYLHTLWHNPQRISPADIGFITTKGYYGWMHCMSAHFIDWEGIRFPTAEHLFQWLRFDEYPNVQDKILSKKSPMTAKMVAREHLGCLGRTGSPDEQLEDIRNMRRVLEVKLKQHPDLKIMLIRTGQNILVEDCSNRDRGSARFWGAVKVGDHWHGENALGCLWMEMRDLP